MNETSRKTAYATNKTWRFLLALILATEVVLTLCLSRLGWLGTGNALLVSCAVLFMAAPILVGVFLFVRTRFRFGIRTLFALCFLVALFLWMTVLPIVHYNRERVGVRFLLQNRVDLDLSLDQMVGVPVWLSPIYGGELAMPDKSLTFVMLSGDPQVDAFCQVADRFSNLSGVLVYKVSETGYRNLNQTLKSLPNFRELDIGDSEPNAIAFESLGSLQALVIRETTGVQTPFKDQVLRDIVKLAQIESLDLHEFNFDSNELTILSQAAKLKKVRFYRCRVTSDKVDALKRLMPQTEFILERLPTPSE